MGKIAIVYASKYGQTEKIAKHIQRRLADRGHDVIAVSLDRTPEFKPGISIDRVIAGGPVYIGRYPKVLTRWIIENKGNFSTESSGFFSVSLNAADPSGDARVADRALLHKFFRETGWTPGFSASFAGALKYPSYNILLRYLMKKISSKAGGPLDTSKEFELTDWSVIDSFADAFTGTVESNWLTPDSPHL
jgi:menaquinone-dependent protoporphyrinogen oxidase